MIVTATHGKIYRHDEAGLKALQAEHPEVYAKVVKHGNVEKTPEKVQNLNVTVEKKKSKKASTK